MNVRLAAQTLSESATCSLKFCLKEGIPGFEGCEATIKFLQMFNGLFDILNSRNLKSTGWKSPMQEKNYEMCQMFLLEARSYILSLKESVNNLPLVAGRRKTGFVGFIMCIDSAISTYETLVMSHEFHMNFLLTYKFSQDHIELFFGQIRSMGGSNNNPTARQFSKAYKQLLTHNEIQDVTRGNCLPLNSITVLTASSFTTGNVICQQEIPSVTIINKSVTKSRASEDISEFHEIEDYCINYDELSTCSEKIVAYIAGFVVSKLKQTIGCEFCLAVLVSIPE